MPFFHILTGARDGYRLVFRARAGAPGGFCRLGLARGSDGRRTWRAGFALEPENSARGR